MQQQTKAYVYAITAVLLWSTAASAFKLTLRHTDFMHMLFGASVVSFLFLAIMAAVTGRLQLLMTYSFRQYLASALLGLLNPALYYIVLFKAYSLLTAQEALVLNYTWPIMLAVLSIPLLKQPLTLRSVTALAVSFAGVIVIATGGRVLSLRFTDPAGVSLALFSAVVWGMYWIYNVRDGRDEVMKLFLNFAFGTVYIAVVLLLASGFTMPDGAGFIGMVYIGLFEMGVTFVLWLRGLRLSETAAQVSVLVYASPFISLVFIRVLVGETIAFPTVAGLVLIVSGIAIQHISNMKST